MALEIKAMVEPGSLRKPELTQRFPLSLPPPKRETHFIKPPPSGGPGGRYTYRASSCLPKEHVMTGGKLLLFGDLLALQLASQRKELQLMTTSCW